MRLKLLLANEDASYCSKNGFELEHRPSPQFLPQDLHALVSIFGTKPERAL